MERDDLTSMLMNLLPGKVTLRENSGCPAVCVDAVDLPAVARKLHDDPALLFTMLMSHTCIDWLEQERFELIYLLRSIEQDLDLLVSVSIPRDTPVISSVSSVWAVAEWQEREVYDMFGVGYEDHPDLRRVLLEDDWKGFPLRRDYKDSFMLEMPK